MGLFSKKVCSICGGEIGLFGNRKLEDGNMCKECAAKLSPFFSDRRSSTVAEIQQQLAYREANKAEVAAFRVTRSLGEGMKVLLDEDNRKFMVTRATRYVEANPDVMSFSDVTNCTYKINESKREVEQEEPAATATKAAGAAGAVPPARAMNSDMAAHAPAPAPRPMGAAGYAQTRAVPPQAAPHDLRGHQADMARAAAAGAAAAAHARAQVAEPVKQEPVYEYDYDFMMTINVRNPYFDTITFQVNTDSIDSKESLAFQNAQAICEDIKDTLMGIHAEVRAAAAPKQAVACSRCGATTIPDANGCCEYCGGALL